MNMKRFLHTALPSLLALWAGALLVVSCEWGKEVILERQLVLEGWIDSGGHPMVLLSEALPLTDGKVTGEDILDGVAKWAKVTVSDGEEEVVLTGRTDPNYFPPYVFTTSKIKGVPGKTYTLRAEYKGKVATAATTIPEPQPLEKIYTKSISDTSWTIVCGFTAPPDKGHYYKFMTMVEGRDSRYHGTALGAVSDEAFDGYTEVHLFSTRRIFSWPYLPDIHPGDRVWVKFCTIDKVAYQFWENFEVNVAANMESLYEFNSDMSSNVQGALGYWTGYGVSEYKVKVGPEKAGTQEEGESDPSDPT